MKTKGLPGAACALALMLIPVTAIGQDAGPTATPPQASTQPDSQATAQPPRQALFPKERLDQMLAPIALYPDELITNIMMASTYPMQVVEASRWLKDPQNAALKGDALLDAIRPMSWDPSIKFLVPFPHIVQQLDDHLDWMQDLGTAFTNQQADVMAEVQHLRQLAMSCGKLKSTPQMTVSRRGGAIAIAPANPAVAYVPVYSPAVVYGGWPYPAYPPLYFPPLPGFFLDAGFDFGIGIGFSIGFDIVGPLWGWAYPDWGAGVVNVNIDRVTRITEINRTVINERFAGGVWHHTTEAVAARTASAAAVASRHGTTDPRTGTTHHAALRTASRSHAGTQHGTHRYASSGHHAAGRAYAHAGSATHGQRYAHSGGSAHGGQHYAPGGSAHRGFAAGGGSHGGPARGPAVAMAGGGGARAGGGAHGGAPGGRQHGH